MIEPGHFGAKPLDAQQANSETPMILGVVILAFGIAVMALVGTFSLSRVEHAYQLERV